MVVRGFHVEGRDFCLASKKGRRKVREDGNGFFTVIFGNSKQVKWIINLFFLFTYFKKISFFSVTFSYCCEMIEKERGVYIDFLLWPNAIH